jgi:hypothetical protein
MCESKDTESPRIVMFLKNGELRKISIAGEGVVVDKAQVVTVLDLIIAVFAVFYVFNLGLPPIFLTASKNLLRTSLTPIKSQRNSIIKPKL